MARDPGHRSHGTTTASGSRWYAFSENFVLLLSHDEVVYGKGCSVRKMPGDDCSVRLRHLRLPRLHVGASGKKLLFMGCEFAQWNEWNGPQPDWPLLEQAPHASITQRPRDLNSAAPLSGAAPARCAVRTALPGVSHEDAQHSVIVFERRAAPDEAGHAAQVLVIW